MPWPTTEAITAPVTARAWRVELMSESFSMVCRMPRTWPSGLASALANTLTTRFRSSPPRMPSSSIVRRTAPASIASRITPWAITSSLLACALMPITITTFCSSSMPAEVDATEDDRLQSCSTASSVSAAAAASPVASATPSAEAPRE